MTVSKTHFLKEILAFLNYYQLDVFRTNSGLLRRQETGGWHELCFNLW